MWKLLSILSVISVVFLAGCASTKTQVANGHSAPAGSELTLKSDVIQESLEKLPETHVPVEIRPGVTMSVSRVEFYGQIPCRSYRMSFDQEGYVCRNDHGWIPVNRTGMVNERGTPTGEPRDKNQKQLAQEQRQKSFEKSREHVAQNEKAQKSATDTSKKAFSQKEQNDDAQKASRDRIRSKFAKYRGS